MSGIGAWTIWITWILPTVIRGSPWVVGPCSDVFETGDDVTTSFEGVSLDECSRTCISLDSSSRSELALWDTSHSCRCFRNNQIESVVRFLNTACRSSRSTTDTKDVERGVKTFGLILRGPTLDGAELRATLRESTTSHQCRYIVALSAIARPGKDGLVSTLLHLDVFWFLNGQLDYVDEDVPVFAAVDLKVEAVWDSSLECNENDVIQVVLSTGIDKLSVTGKLVDLPIPPLSVQCIVKRSPVCWPPHVQAPGVSGSRVFVGDSVEFVATASRADDNQFHHWIFPNGKNFTLLSSNGTSKEIHTFEDEGVHAINVSVALENWRAAVTFVMIALRKVYFNYDIKDCSVVEAGRSSVFSMSATILNNRSWTIEMVCNHGATFRTTFNTSTSACAPVRKQLPIRFDQTGEHRCTLKASDGRNILHLGVIECQVFTKLGSVFIRTKNAVASGTPVEISAQVSPDFGTCNRKITWKIYKQHADIYYTVDTFTFVYTFKKPGRYNVHVDVFNPLSRVTHEVSIDVQDIIGGLTIESPKAVEHRRTHSTVLFEAKFMSGSSVFCRWMLHCKHFAVLKPQNYNLEEETCNFRRIFRSPTSCSITVTVFNKVSQLELSDKFKIFIEEPIPEIEVVTPSEVKFGNYVTVTIYIPKLRQPVYIDINGGLVTRKVLYRPHQLMCSAAFLPEQPKPFLVRVRTYNNVSSVVVRKIILVIPELRKVDIVNVGCTAVGFPLRFVVYVDGTVPKEGDSLLFHWLIRTPRHSQSFYTSVPIAHSEELLSPGDYSVTVTVSNKVSSISGSLIGQVFASILSPCLHHEPFIPVGRIIHLYVLGLPTPLPFSKATLQIRLDDDPKPLHLRRWEWISNSTGGNGALRWRYISQSSGFHRIMCLLFLEASDIVSNLSFVSGFQVVYRLTSVRITSPLTVYISRFTTVPVTWHADVHPHTHGCIFFWDLDNKQYVTATPRLTFHLPFPLGTYVLELKVWNALGSIESSMVLEVVSALLLLNYATTNFFSNHSGCFNFEINQLVPPSGVFVDFGDNSVYDSKVDNSSSLLFVSKTNSSSLSLCHTYKYIGIYDVFFNISNFISSIEHWTTVIVEEKISGVELILLTPPVVALLEDVTVACLVDKGTNLEFEWDFGDGSGGQYTREDAPLVDSFKIKRTAHHSYGIASLYNVSVHIFNNYESIVVHLNTSIQAVERIEQLHLQPRIRGQYSAPLYKNKVEEADRPFSTVPIEFEAWVWRGSDVQFQFHFGDGNSKSVSSLLNAWSLRYAAVKHIYSAEGQYEVFVTATNLLTSVNESLEQPFYVQFPPENLMLEKKYYIIEHHSNLTLRATITQGTNVSYSWKVGDQYIEESGNTLFLPFLEPGIYVVSVEVFNHVTDFGYRRPSATAKIYVQEKLLGVQVCIHSDGREMCDAGVVDLPLDEEVHYLAKVIPPTETALRFIWQLDADEIRRTSVPFLKFKYQQAGWYSINVTAQNHISSVSSLPIRLNLVQKVANLTSILCQGPNLVNQPITFRALYWFGTNLTFEWDFGDGSNPVLTTSSSAQHTYNEVGEYWVTVNAWNQFSHANITSNMFFLHHMCRKPEISFLHQWNRIASSSEDILLEAAISILCKSANVEYNWNVQGSNKNVTHLETLNQRQLVIPSGFLDPGTYNVNLKVNMVGTIVYADLLTTLVVEQSRPVVFIEGGFVRAIGVDDSRELIANVIFADNATHPVNYVWSCIPLIQKHHPCFNDPHLLHFHNSSRLTIPTSLISHNLGAIVVNVTIDSGGPISASQVLEIKQIPHMLQVDIECEECHDHRVNHLDQIQMRVACRNCGALLEYQWKIWIIEDENSRIHFSNHECVQADGSTFFIVAPNVTETAVNSTHLLSKNIQQKFFNFSEDPMLSEKPHDTVDLPPFPNLPGFPEENTTLEEPKLLRSLRNADVLDIPNRIPYSDSLHEGEAFYEDNSTSEDSPYSDFISFFDDGLLLGSPDYVITEEGVPGEGGSAAARNQSLPNLAISGDEILEEAGKPRMKTSGNTNVLVDNPRLLEEDALRDKFSRKSPVPHIVSRSRSMLYSLEHYTTTGFDKEYLVIKPGVLKSGRSYLVHAKVVNKENNQQEGFAMEYFRVNMGPVNGRCTLMPVEGFSLHFDFRLHCLEWRSNHLPLYYELHYSREKDSAGHLIYFGLNSNVKFNLPAGLASDSYHVYLNVIVRDNLGAQTKVCSLARKVMPAHMNVSMENYVYNETFHPRASLKRLLGEKHNQAVLQKIHVLASSLNSNNSFLEAPNIYAIRSKIRQEFFEIVCSLKITNKVEATQIISVLYEIIADVTISAAELQKCYNIYKRIDDLQPRLFKFFASQQMHTELVVFLAKLAFVSNFIYPRNNDLIEIARLNLMIKIKNFLKTRLSIESPLRIDVPHLSVAAFYITKTALILEPFILLKNTAIQYLDNSIFISKYFKSRKKRDWISSEKCLSFMAHEYDYINSPHKQNMHSSAKSSVLLSFDSCKDEDFEIGSLNVSINFIKTSENKNNRSVVLKENCMNVHAINITEEEAGHSLLFYVKLEADNNTEFGIAVDVMFRSQNHPTLKEFDMKMSLPSGTSEINLFLSPDKLKVPGVYYVSMLPRDFSNKKTTEKVWLYKVFIWKDVCLGKVGDFWSSKNCHVLETSNSSWTHCKCSAEEVTSYSVPLEWELILVPVSQLIDPYFNSVPLIAFIFILLLYCILLYINFRKDQSVYLSHSPVPLRDNNGKHKQFYLIILKTGFYFNSGTTASVFVVLHGTKDVTETRQLIGSNAKRFSFQKGSVDMFLMSTAHNLGPLLKLEVWHNNQGPSPSWYLKSISIKDLNKDLFYHFDCHNWLSAEKGDFLIERELTVAESSPKLKELFFDDLLTCMNDFNMWNAVVSQSPASFFTGVQRITCCLCFLLNSAFLLTSHQEEYIELSHDKSVLDITRWTYITSCLTALASTLFQVFFTILFRFSSCPSINVDPKLRDFFCSLSLFSLNCWLKSKRSTSSHSTHRSSSSSLDNRSDSLYSSFEDSSIMSVPDLLEESSLSEREKHLTSCPDMSDPVSPLQKTLSTWQTLENWLKKKQNLILKPDTKRHSYVFKTNSVSRSSFSVDQSDTQEDSSQAMQFSFSSLPEHFDTAEDDTLMFESVIDKGELNLQFYFPCFHPYVYLLAWFGILLNLAVTCSFILFKASGFTISFTVFFFKAILISIVCSCLVITPFLNVLLAVFLTLKFCLRNCKQNLATMSLQSSEEKKSLRAIDHNASSNLRMEYFKKYLRPPKEPVLEQFRQMEMREKKTWNFYSDTMKHIFVLFLILAISIPEHTQMKYLQRKSIENALFRSVPPTTKSMPSKFSLLNWLEYDFLDIFLSEHLCLHGEEDCHTSTQCIIVGGVMLRRFHSDTSSHPDICSSSERPSNAMVDDFGGIYERRMISGHDTSYCAEDEWQVLSEEYFYAYNQLHHFVGKLNASSAASVEFLLFNPVFSTFISTSILFEATKAGLIAMSHEIILVTIPSGHQFYYLKMFINSLFFIYILFNCRSLIWKMVKNKAQFWKQGSNYLMCVFILVYLIYLFVFVAYIHLLEAVSARLMSTQLQTNVNITEMVVFETCVHSLCGILIFIHLMQSLRVICFNNRLKKLLKRVISSQKKILYPFFMFLVIIFASSALVKHFIGAFYSFSHPLFGFTKGIDGILKDFGKPEVTDAGHTFQNFLALFTTLVLGLVHLYLFSVIRSVLLNYESSNIADLRNKGITLKETGQLLKRKVLPFFYSQVPQVILYEDYAPPVDFLLLELERLADLLVTKAENLFPDRREKLSNIASYLKSECESQLEKENGLKLLEVEFLNIAFEPSHTELEDDNVFKPLERLISTIPRPNKGKQNAFLPSSFHSSLRLEKESPSQQNRIRKTYPLYHLDSDTSSISEQGSKSSLLIRRTKSRGKFKNENFDLDIE